MNQKDTLRSYVKTQLDAGVAASAVRQQLIQNGWGSEIVDEVLAEFTQSPSSTVAATPGSTPGVEAQQPAATQPQGSYSIRQALKEAVEALKTNLATIAIVSVIGLVLPFVVMAIIVVAGVIAVISAAAGGAVSSEGAGLTGFLIVGIVGLLLAGVAAALVSAFAQAMVGLAVYDGAEGRKSSVSAVMKAGFRRTVRVFVASLLYMLIVSAPLLAIAVVSFILVPLVPALAFVAFLLAAVGIVACVVLAIRFILLPLVALFEPELPVGSLFARTKQLMSGGGTKFILKLYLVMLLVGIILSALLPSEDAVNQGFSFSSILVMIVSAAISALFLGVMVVFYRNRRAVNA